MTFNHFRDFNNRLIAQARKQARRSEIKKSDIQKNNKKSAKKVVTIILDTNVFISGIFWSGPPYQILKAWQQRKIELIVSQDILNE